MRQREAAPNRRVGRADQRDAKRPPLNQRASKIVVELGDDYSQLKVLFDRRKYAIERLVGRHAGLLTRRPRRLAGPSMTQLSFRITHAAQRTARGPRRRFQESPNQIERRIATALL